MRVSICNISISCAIVKFHIIIKENVHFSPLLLSQTWDSTWYSNKPEVFFSFAEFYKFISWISSNNGGKYRKFRQMFTKKKGIFFNWSLKKPANFNNQLRKKWQILSNDRTKNRKFCLLVIEKQCEFCNSYILGLFKMFVSSIIFFYVSWCPLSSLQCHFFYKSCHLRPHPPLSPYWI